MHLRRLLTFVHKCHDQYDNIKGPTGTDFGFRLLLWSIGCRNILAVKTVSINLNIESAKLIIKIIKTVNNILNFIL